MSGWLGERSTKCWEDGFEICIWLREKEMMIFVAECCMRVGFYAYHIAHFRIDARENEKFESQEREDTMMLSSLLHGQGDIPSDFRVYSYCNEIVVAMLSRPSHTYRRFLRKGLLESKSYFNAI